MIDKEQADNTMTKQASKQASKQAIQMSLFDFEKLSFGVEKYVRRIDYDEARPFIMNIHYARRMPSISYAFGLFVNGELVGVVTYGLPASPPLCRGIAGYKNRLNVLELNRLVIHPKYNGKNYASFLVGNSLKQLPNKTFVVSYADTAWSHIGYVYQATNFLYTGLSAQRTDTWQPTGKHGRHLEQSDNSLRQTRSRKHRYVYLVGDKRTKKQMLKELKYKVKGKYPKGNEVRYDIKNPQAINPIKRIVVED